MKVLVIGANGMIGSTMYRVLSKSPELTVWGSVRGLRNDSITPKAGKSGGIVTGSDVRDMDALTRLFGSVDPDAVVNCVGITKHLPSAEDPLTVIPLNALYPHRLANLCQATGARLIHVSTDCVFAGRKGNYIEADTTDAVDLYGRTKAMGEIVRPGVVTLRTSTIGHELNSKFGLLEWFLSQPVKCKGYRRAMFSGLPTFEFARVVRDFILPNPRLGGLYHVGGFPLDKFSLLNLIAKQYGKRITIEPDDAVAVDRTLNSGRFNAATGYVAAPWPQLIEEMYEDGKQRD